MRRLPLTLLALSALALSACGDSTPDAAPAATETSRIAAKADAMPASKEKPEAEAEAKAMTETPMDTVESGLKDGSVHVYDANNPDTRKEHGVIEGAVLLDNYREYDLASLPEAKDSPLVFYCGSTLCTASDKAADRALQAGYTNVSVMREGIKGWKEAGKTTVAWTADGAEQG